MCKRMGWGNNSDRQDNIEVAGYNYDEVQNAVNMILKGDAATDSVSYTHLAEHLYHAVINNFILRQ